MVSFLCIIGVYQIHTSLIHWCIAKFLHGAYGSTVSVLYLCPHRMMTATTKEFHMMSVWPSLIYNQDTYPWPICVRILKYSNRTVTLIKHQPYFQNVALHGWSNLLFFVVVLCDSWHIITKLLILGAVSCYMLIGH